MCNIAKLTREFNAISGNNRRDCSHVIGKALDSGRGLSLTATRFYKAVNPSWNIISQECATSPIARAVISLENEEVQKEGRLSRMFGKIKELARAIKDKVVGFARKIKGLLPKSDKNLKQANKMLKSSDLELSYNASLLHSLGINGVTGDVDIVKALGVSIQVRRQIASLLSNYIAKSVKIMRSKEVDKEALNSATTEFYNALAKYAPDSGEKGIVINNFHVFKLDKKSSVYSIDYSTAKNTNKGNGDITIPKGTKLPYFNNGNDFDVISSTIAKSTSVYEETAPVPEDADLANHQWNTFMTYRDISETDFQFLVAYAELLQKLAGNTDATAGEEQE